MVSVQQPDFKTLLTRLDRDTRAAIHLPHDPEYQTLLKRFSERNEKPAGAIFLPTTSEEVATAVKFVSENNIDLAVVCGGHSGSGASSTDGGLVIDLRQMKMMAIDQEKKTITCGGGCLWKDVDYALGEYNLATVGGTVNHTGIGGLTLGGGFGYLSGKYGLVIDNLLSIEMVLASGEIVTASKTENPDLFWACCGAGANFGIATKFTYQCYDQKEKVFMGPLIFPPVPSVVAGVLDFMNSFLASDKEDGKLGVVLGITCAPPDFKNPVVVACTFYDGSQEEGTKFLKPLLDLNPLMNMMKEMPYQDANGVLADMVTHGDRKLMKGFTFTLPLRVETFSGMIDNYKEFIEKYAHDPVIGQSLAVFEFQSNKKINEFTTGCFGNRGDHYNGCVLPRWSLIENDEDIQNWARKNSRELTHKNGVVKKDGREPFYANYDDLKTSATDLFGENMPRLVELKSKYDPRNIFNKWHSLVPEKKVEFREVTTE